MSPLLRRAFVDRVVGAHGALGEEWLNALPRLIDDCVIRWNLTLGLAYHLSYNYVAPAVMTSADGDVTDVVLKLGIPGVDFDREMAALHFFKGQGCAGILRAAPGLGTMVVEQVQPGVTLDRATADDEAATLAAAALMRRLAQPVSSLDIFQPLAEWTTAFGRLRERNNGGTGPLPERLVMVAETLAADLIASSPEPILLHGDLHHGNILTSERGGCLAIDPKGVIGDPAFEPSAFLLNPRAVSINVMRRRLSIFAEVAGLDRGRIRRWGIVRAVLSACWTLEDQGTDYACAIEIAEQLIAIP